VAITYTLKRASEESGLSTRTLQYAIARGELDSFRIGHRRLIRVQALEEFLNRKKLQFEAQTKDRDK
jgi:excisionase family DNA binding protein